MEDENRELEGQAFDKEATSIAPQRVRLPAEDEERVDRIVAEGRARDGASWRGNSLVKTFVEAVLNGSMTIPEEAEMMITARIAQIDQLLSNQVNAILHHPEFQKLEGAWLGLRHLVDQAGTDDLLKIKVLNFSKQELQADLRDVSSFDDTALFRRVYEEEYRVFDGHPYGVLVGVYEFGNKAEDLDCLEQIAHIAAAAASPFLAAAAPELAGVRTWTDMCERGNVADLHAGDEFARWRAFRAGDDSRFVALCLPRTMGRLPYGKDTMPVDGFDYEEGVNGTDHAQYLWTNAAFSLADCMAKSFVKYGLCAEFSGLEGGGVAEGLPVHNFYTESGDLAMKCPTEIQILDRRQEEFATAGLIPLAHCKDTDYAVFFQVPTCHWDEKGGTGLQNMMVASRFVQYLKAIMRDKIGSFLSARQAEIDLNTWITKHVRPIGIESEAASVGFPLASTDVRVRGPDLHLGVFHCAVSINPRSGEAGAPMTLEFLAFAPGYQDPPWLK